MSCPFGFGVSEVGSSADDGANGSLNEDAPASCKGVHSAAPTSVEHPKQVFSGVAYDRRLHELDQDYFPGIGSICLEQSRRIVEHDRPLRVLPEPPLRPEELNQGYWRDVEDEELCVDADEAEGTPEPVRAPDVATAQEAQTEIQASAFASSSSTGDVWMFSRPDNQAEGDGGSVPVPSCLEMPDKRLHLTQDPEKSDLKFRSTCSAGSGLNPMERLGVVPSTHHDDTNFPCRRDGARKADALECSSITESEHSLVTERTWQGGLCGDYEPRTTSERHSDRWIQNEHLPESRNRGSLRRLARTPNWRRDAVDASWPPRNGTSIGTSRTFRDEKEKADELEPEPKTVQPGYQKHVDIPSTTVLELAACPEPEMELPTEQRGTAYIRQRKGRPLYYSAYLKLDRLLSCQEPISWRFGDRAHDEMLFITIHQVYELWFKQLLYELDSLRSLFLQDVATSNEGAAHWRVSTDANRMMNLALHRLDRMVEIQRLLVEQIRVLETMTPQEFLTFRDYLFPASGFQSWQYRLLEVKLGVRAEQRVSNHWKLHLSEEHQAILSKAEQEPSLFDLINQWLERLPFVVTTEADFNFWDAYQRATERMLALDRAFIDREIHAGADRARAYRELSRMRNLFRSVYVEEIHQEMVERGQRRMSFQAMAAALLIMLYERGAPYLQLPHRVLRRLLDLDEGMAQWRFRHVQLVSRMIGSKTGTGGSLGVHYLMLTLESSRVFTDLGNMAALLIPERLLPDLPGKLRHQLEYAWTQG
ncbi:hypothetical protein CCYA_CCYA12G3288 [Cyanidiococcus yangmingshanensis]|nr:hypothetical protein CCYA_CCYA12G3288 [Cyanidiococcus yangmingshanensis]